MEAAPTSRGLGDRLRALLGGFALEAPQANLYALSEVSFQEKSRRGQADDEFTKARPREVQGTHETTQEIGEAEC
jgi:hypothetical protein